MNKVTGDSQQGCRKTVLPSGLRIVTEHVPHVRSLALGVWINCGSRDEAPHENGISHFIEHAVFKGTSRRKTHQIAQYLEAVGGYVNAFTTKDATCFYARTLQPHLARAVNLLGDLVQRPLFPPGEMEKEKQVILEEMRGIDDDPEDLVHDMFEKNLFGRHPLGQPVIGTPENILALDGERLHAFVERHYTARNMVVAASGAVDHDQLVDLCEREFDRLPAGESVRRRRPSSRTGREVSYRRKIQQTHLVIGNRIPGIKSPLRPAISILNVLLGDGMGSRLFQRLREKHGLSYNVYSFVSLYDDIGAFGVYAGMEQSSAARSRELILDTLAELKRKPVSIRELNRTREQVIGSLLFGLESMSGRMSRLGRDELVFGRTMDIDELLSRTKAVTPDDVQRAAADFFSSQDYTTTLLQPG